MVISASILKKIITSPCYLLWFFATCLFYLSGCQTTLPTTMQIPEIAPYAKTPALSPTPMKHNERLTTLYTCRKTFWAIAGKPKGKHLEMLTSPADNDAVAPWRRSMSIKGIQHVSRADDGSIMLHKMEESKHNSRTHFATPIPVVAAHLKPNQPISFTSDVTVYSRKTNKQMDSGTSTITLVHEADQVLELPIGSRRCKRIRITYQGKFKFAKVTSVTIAWYAKPEGLVAEHYHEKGVAIILPWEKKYTLILGKYESSDLTQPSHP